MGQGILLLKEMRVDSIIDLGMSGEGMAGEEEQLQPEVKRAAKRPERACAHQNGWNRVNLFRFSRVTPMADHDRPGHEIFPVRNARRSPARRQSL